LLTYPEVDLTYYF